ncbi:hypothetical protein [Microbacterium soli]|uniref:Uncharacterized protein n=1 Tax=Microbacterium soli TaxID=446075 RepID=A0ABP7NK02_9MICO
MIYLDVTRESIVVGCDVCQVWYVMAFTKLEAWEAAAAHEKRTHPGSTQAQDALSEAKRKARLAV